MNQYITTTNNISRIAKELRKNPNMRGFISAIETKYGKPHSDYYLVVLTKREELRNNGNGRLSDGELASRISEQTGIEWSGIALKIRYAVWDKLIPQNPCGSIMIINDGI